MTAPLAIPLSVLQLHTILVGMTGGGKTFTAKGAAEAMLDAGRRLCIVDPAGVWWGLRSSADGKEAGFAVTIFGGERADVPIGEHSGKPLAKLIAEGNIPAIVDVSEMTLGAQQRFATEFFGELYRVNRKALHLIIDEADVFAPQQPLPDQKLMLHRIDQIARRGRVRGFRLMAITQRPAVLHKNVMSQCRTLIAMRVMSPQDRKAVEDWIKGQADLAKGKKIMDSLARLKTGEGWLWSPETGLLARQRFPMIRTFDSSRTPGDDEEIPEPRMLAEVEIAGLAEALNPQAEEEATGEKNAHISGAGKMVGEAELKAARKEGHVEGFQHGYRKGRQDQQAEMVHTLQTTLKDLGWFDQPSAEDRESPSISVSLQNFENRKPGPKNAPETASLSAANGSLPPAALRWLELLCGKYPLVLSWTQAATLLRRKARGGQFNAIRKALVEGGYVEERNGQAIPKRKAFDLIGIEPATAADLALQGFLEALPTAPRSLLEALHDKGPLTRDELAGATGRAPRGGQWNAAMKMLRDNDLIKEEGGRLALAEWLSPTGGR